MGDLSAFRPEANDVLLTVAAARGSQVALAISAALQRPPGRRAHTNAQEQSKQHRQMSQLSRAQFLSVRFGHLPPPFIGAAKARFGAFGGKS
uniref:Uncharacterized protein n=1 Tax=Trichuris muris TaxID=70415 RepID=A0A5S6QKE6_TRIMR